MGRIPLALVLTAGIGAAGAVEPDDGAGPAAGVVGSDDPPRPVLELAPAWELGAEMEVEVIGRRNRDLDSAVDDDLVSIEPKGKVDLLFRPNPRFSAFADLELSKILLPRSPEGSTSLPARLELKELHVTFNELLRGASFQIGRAKFRDRREWLYDEELDTARGFFEVGPVELELSVSRLNWFDRDLLNGDSAEDERVANVFAIAHLDGPEQSRSSLYLLRRDGDDSDGEDLLFAGVQSAGRLAPAASYWLDASLVWGDDGPNDVLGAGVDLGVIKTLPGPLAPSITLAVAYGTGDSDTGGRDGNFRQTGLQENEGAFAGIASFQYYGEVLDPELSNLTILTAGLGIRPTPSSSVDLVYHYYRQNEAVPALRDAAIDAEPDGMHRELGMGVDLVVGLRSGEALESRLILGWFFPGRAFADDASIGYFAGLEIVREF